MKLTILALGLFALIGCKETAPEDVLVQLPIPTEHAAMMDLVAQTWVFPEGSPVAALILTKQSTYTLYLNESQESKAISNAKLEIWKLGEVGVVGKLLGGTITSKTGAFNFGVVLGLENFGSVEVALFGTTTATPPKAITATFTTNDGESYTQSGLIAKHSFNAATAVASLEYYESLGPDEMKIERNKNAITITQDGVSNTYTFITKKIPNTNGYYYNCTMENDRDDHYFELQYYNHSELSHSDFLTQERHVFDIVDKQRTGLTRYNYNKERALTETTWDQILRDQDDGDGTSQTVTAWWEDGNPVKSKCTSEVRVNADTATFMHTYTKVANKVGFIAPNHLPGTYTVTGEADYAAFLFGILGAAPKNLSASTRRLRFDDEIEDIGTYSYKFNAAGEPTEIAVKYPLPERNYTINLRFAKIARE